MKDDKRVQKKPVPIKADPLPVSDTEMFALVPAFLWAPVSTLMTYVASLSSSCLELLIDRTFCVLSYTSILIWAIQLES